jgi:hypothetical protein
MKSVILFTAFFLLLAAALPCAGQQKRSAGDSVKVTRDSLMYKTIDEEFKKNEEDSLKYKALEEFSKKSKFTTFLHKFIFKPVGRSVVPPSARRRIKRISQHSRAEGKIIRRIEITTLDPFGYSVRDTSVRPKVLVMKAGNFLHVKTNTAVIRNLLLIREHQHYDSLMVKESERLIRSQRYVREVTFTIQPVKKDSVDIYIRVLDVWSLEPSIRRGNVTGGGLSDLNFAGTGNTLKLSSYKKKENSRFITSMNFLMPNIRNTYISMNIKLTNNNDFGRFFFTPASIDTRNRVSDNSNVIRSIELSRSFYSPTTKWAGGIFAGRLMTTQSYLNFDSIRYVSYPTNIEDIWIGRSWQMFRTHLPGDRITSFILAGRLIFSHTPDRQPEAITNNIFNINSYYFWSIGITSRRYLQDKYIFNYGKTEDVPEGRAFGITFGREYRQKSRLYIGINASFGTYYNFGYLSTHLEYGTFKGNKSLQQGVLTGNLNYYTRLLSMGNWKIRQFVRPSFIFGINRLPSEILTHNFGIKGFETVVSDATYMTSLALQTQSYAPWDLAGFRFGPYFFAHFGILGKQSTPFGNNRFYSLLGFGMLIKNDYLMFNTFQISVSFYPFIPGKGNNIFMTNAYKTSDYGFRDFETSKPGVVQFR